MTTCILAFTYCLSELLVMQVPPVLGHFQTNEFLGNFFMTEIPSPRKRRWILEKSENFLNWNLLNDSDNL